MKNYLFGLLFFFVFYRLSILNSGVSMNLLLGLLFLLTSFLSKKKYKFDKNTAILMFVSTLLLIYSIIIDLYLINDIIGINSFFSIRLLSIFIMSFSSSLFFKSFFIKNSEDLYFLLRFTVIVQFFFFILLFFFPNFKPIVYGLFGAGDSVNLLDWNMNSRGFGIGSEINYTGPIITVIIAFISFRSFLFKLLVFISQITNANTTLITLLHFLKKNHLKKLFLFLVISILVFFSFDININIESFFPRFNKELETGFTVTILYLISDHFIILNESILDYLFGVPVMLIPGANSLLSSDSGWIIMLNYGGIIFIALFVVFLILIISKLRASFSFKIFILIIGLLLNFKGLILGPNAYFYLLFLFSSFGNNTLLIESLKHKKIC
jgi:hypothetical protein